MNSQDTQIRKLVVAFAATALALVAAAPAGAWADPSGGRQDGNGIGSIPPPEIQSLPRSVAPVTSNLLHEGVQADRRLGVGRTSLGPMDVNLRTAVAVARENARLAALDPHIRNVVLDHSSSVSVVPAGAATSGDDGFEWSPAAIGLTAALAAALLMAVATVGVAGGKRRRVATL